MKNFNFTSLIQPIAIIALFFVSMMVYFSPIFEDKKLQTHDVQQWQGMAKEMLDHNEQVEQTGEGTETHWTNSMFGGMPTYLIAIYPDNLTRTVHSWFNTNHKHPEMIAFMYFVCFFIALLLFELPLWLCMLGALFYGFSSYFFIIIEAGHVTKSVALGYMPLVIASVVACYRNKLWLGAALFALSLAFQLLANHLQITYYTMYIILFFVFFQLYEAWRTKALWKHFFKPSLFLLVAAVFAIGANAANLYMTYDYGQDSMRGKSELTHDADNKTGGLDRDYATQAWSYGIDETLNLFIPNFKGGSSGGSLSEDSETYKTLKQAGVPTRNAQAFIQQAPLYWGTQSFTSGPVYIGAIVVFLFVFGLMFVRGTVKWWLASLTLFSVLLAWGNNFMPLTDFFLSYVPGYNKFRTVSMILIIAQFTMPLLAIIALSQSLRNDERREEAWQKLKLTLYICGGLLLVLLVSVGSLYDFSTPRDAEQLPEWLVQAVQADRKAMLIGDLWRTLFFVVATFGVLALWYFRKLKWAAVVAILAVLTYCDMWTVNKRYLNDRDFVTQRVNQSHFKKTPADIAILADTDPNFRVMNFTVSPFNDASTSYFHKSIGGYHGAKMKRYQELIDFHLSKMNMNVYNMLNTKYFIVENPQGGQPMAQANPDALGNAWFIQKLHTVPNADAEIQALTDFNPAVEAFADVRFTEQLTDTIFTVDSASTITLTHYAPNDIMYTATNTHAGVAVFSEIYYSKGWNAYIDGELVPHFRVNYVLRALNIPAGTHTIEFKFEPSSYYVSNRISFISSLLLLLGVVIVLGFEIRKKLIN
jgi:MFS family permease